jgi:hypothetical protein
VQLDAGGASEFLTAKGCPKGLQDFLTANVRKMPYRFFICDDSGSMSKSDGTKMIGSGADTKAVPCTRWSELSETLKFHATLAKALNAPTEFRFLNCSGPIQIGIENDGYPLLMQILEGSPGGRTPLCQQVREVVDKIQLMTPSLKENGQKVAVVICTDGEPTGKQNDRVNVEDFAGANDAVT